jgi:hypothetical protein
MRKMEHIIDHSWQSSNNGEAPFVKAERDSAATPDGFKLRVTISSVEMPKAYSMNSIILTMTTWDLEKFAMELIKIAAAARTN